MRNESEKDKLDDTDDFWDIDFMIPKRPAASRDPGEKEREITTSEITFGSDEDRTPEERIPPAAERSELGRRVLAEAERRTGVAPARKIGDGYAEECEVERKIYVPKNNPLIKSVTVNPWPAKYAFYERFRNDAERYFDAKPDGAGEYVPFFSFMPQYSQLTSDMRRHYLSWRESARRLEYRRTDYSYVLLFVYEVLNLPDRIAPEEGVRQLCGIWRNYRADFPKLDRQLCEWVCDYCLIHEVEVPSETIAPFAEKIVRSAELKEFYLGNGRSFGHPEASAMLMLASGYDPRFGKFVTGENKAFFTENIRRAFFHAFDKYPLAKGGEPISTSGFRRMTGPVFSVTKTRREAYSGAICAYNVKRGIEVEYYSCSRSPEIRYMVTDAVKYAENNVRSLLGIKSRFHTPNLPAEIKSSIDEYFAPYKARLKKKAAKRSEAEPPPEYEKLYEADRSELSAEYALRIEKNAWQTTSKLVDAFAEDEDETTDAGPETSTEDPERTTEATGSECPKDGLAMIARGDMSGFAELAKKMNIMPETLAERINEAALDRIGDIVVEEKDGGYAAIEDYKEEIERWITE